MVPFTYAYHEKECQGNYHSVDKGYGLIKVFFYNHSAFILRSAIQNRNDKMIWVQCVQHGDPVWPHDLIQAIGEGLEKAGLITAGK